MLRRFFTPRRARLLNKSSALAAQRRTLSLFGYTVVRERINSSGRPFTSRIPPSLSGFFSSFFKVGGAFVTAVFGFHVFAEYFYSISSTWGPSMLPTLASSGTSVVISKYYRHGRKVQVGDMVSFKHPVHEDWRAIKRVVGMPGDFVLRDTPGKGDGSMIQVPVGHCWVTGDNLAFSRDSRMYGPLPLALVKGKVVAVWNAWLEWPQLVENTLKDVQDDD